MCPTEGIAPRKRHIFVLTFPRKRFFARRRAGRSSRSVRVARAKDNREKRAEKQRDFRLRFHCVRSVGQDRNMPTIYL